MPLLLLHHIFLLLFWNIHTESSTSDEWVHKPITFWWRNHFKYNACHTYSKHTHARIYIRQKTQYNTVHKFISGIFSFVALLFISISLVCAPHTALLVPRFISHTWSYRCRLLWLNIILNAIEYRKYYQLKSRRNLWYFSIHLWFASGSVCFVEMTFVGKSLSIFMWHLKTDGFLLCE